MISGSIILYACGITGLKLVTGMTLAKAFAVGMFPFLLGDAVKIAAAAAIAKTMRPIIRVKPYTSLS
jgi:biotin transport system substrate-specific component